MANTYTQIHIQCIFAVQNRASLIRKAWKNDLCRYITGIVQNNGHKLLAIDGMPDHLHILFGMRPTQSISDLMKDVKGSSSTWINDKSLTTKKFSWQEGDGAFSYSKSDVYDVINYIRNQEAHHKRKTFDKEYIELLKKFEVLYDEKYVLRGIEYDLNNL